MNYNFIAIEGNIGSGKTTLAKKFALDFNSRLLLEEFSDNPFLPNFYKSPDEYAFPLELFFMAERYHQLKKERDTDIFQPLTIADYFFMKSRLFAQNNLKQDEFNLFNRLFDIMFTSLTYPDLIIYLYANIERLQYNIRERGRIFEQDISENYLTSIQENYLDYFKKQNNFPVVVVDVTKVDFKEDTLIYNKIKNIVFEKYKTGVHYLDLF